MYLAHITIATEKGIEKKEERVHLLTTLLHKVIKLTYGEEILEIHITREGG